MNRKMHILRSLALIFTASSAVFGVGCTVDDRYKLEDLDKIDTDITLFEEGIAIPVGSISRISIGDLLNSGDESLDDFLKTNAEGEYSICHEGETSLDQAIEDLNLADLASISQISLNQDFSFDIGADTDNFSIAARSYEKYARFTDYALIDVKLDNESSGIDDLHINAGICNYSGIIDGNEDLDLGAKAGNLSHSTTIIRRSSLSSVITTSDVETVHLPGSLVPEVAIPSTDISFSTPSATIHKDVNAIRDIQLDPDARIIIDIKLNNVFLTGGEAVPDVDVDFSSILRIEGGSRINLKDMVLNKANGWHASKTLSVSDLAKTEYGNTISINENVTVSGNVAITNPVATKTSFSNTSGDISFDVSVRFQDLRIASASVELNAIEISKETDINLAQAKDIRLPEEIKDIKLIKLDESKPFIIRITSNNLDILKTKSIPYSLELSFPESMDVEGAVNGILSFTGDLANGSIEKSVVVKSIRPEVKDGLVSFNGMVKARSVAVARNLTISSKDLPEESADDVSFSVEIQGEPAIKDYLITINEINKSATLSEPLDIDVSEIGNIGSFTVIPEGAPCITMQITCPKLSGASIVPGAEGMKIMLPDVIRFDEKKIASELAFNAAENSIIIRDDFPENIMLPIKQIEFVPVKEGDKYFIRSNVGITGGIRIPETDVDQNDLTNFFDTGFGIVVNIPEIKAESISLKDEFCLDIDEQYDLTILSKEDLPAELTCLEEAVLDNTFINIDAMFDGLGDNTLDIDLTVTLPDFISPSTYPVKGKITKGKFAGSRLKVEKISGIDFTSGRDITGTVSVSGTIKASGTTIDLSSLSDKLKASLNVTIGDDTGKIAISKASGKFKYNLNTSQTIEIGDIPESLKGDNVVFDLAAPQLCLELTSNLGIPVSGSIDIIPISGNEELTANKVSLRNVMLPYSEDPSRNDTRKYCICSSKAKCAAGYEPLEANISNLLKQLPDELKITVMADIDDKQLSVIEPSASYTFDIAYRLDVPLAFGDNFRFSTEATIDLSSAEDVTQMGSFGIKAKADNSLPLGLDITVDLLDAEGNVIPQSMPCTISIAPSSTSDIGIYLSPADKSRHIKDARLTVTVTAKPGITLKNTDSVQLLDIVATAPEGLTISTK